MVLAEHSKARYKQASTKEMRSPAVVLGSLEPLIPEPVRFPQLFGNRRLHLNALDDPPLEVWSLQRWGPWFFFLQVSLCPFSLPAQVALLRWGLISQPALKAFYSFSLSQVQTLDSEQEALVDWAVLQLSGSEGKGQRTRLGGKDFSTQVGNKFNLSINDKKTPSQLNDECFTKAFTKAFRPSNSGCCWCPLQVSCLVLKLGIIYHHTPP